MEGVIIKRATTEDVIALQEISIRTFVETFAEANTKENMERYLADSFDINMLTEELKHPDSRFYFALLGERIVGYLKINCGKAQTEQQNGDAVEIERIYVLQEFHSKKVGQLLYNHAVNEATAENAGYIWLGVWKGNKRAISFYEKNGFRAFDKHVFTLGTDEQIDIMMRKEL